MRVSLSAEQVVGPCSRGCGYDSPCVRFNVVGEGHSGDTELICLTCLLSGARSDISMEPLVTGPAPRRKALRANQKTSLRQELDIEEEFGARRQPGSGNQAGAKGDHRRKGELRLEAKFTRDESYRLQLGDLYKLAGEAVGGELPVMVIDFLDPGTRKLRDRFTVIHSNDFKELHAASKNRGPERSPR